MDRALGFFSKAVPVEFKQAKRTKQGYLRAAMDALFASVSGVGSDDEGDKDDDDDDDDSDSQDDENQAPRRGVLCDPLEHGFRHIVAVFPNQRAGYTVSREEGEEEDHPIVADLHELVTGHLEEQQEALKTRFDDYEAEKQAQVVAHLKSMHERLEKQAKQRMQKSHSHVEEAKATALLGIVKTKLNSLDSTLNKGKTGHGSPSSESGSVGADFADVYMCMRAFHDYPSPEAEATIQHHFGDGDRASMLKRTLQMKTRFQMGNVSSVFKNVLLTSPAALTTCEKELERLRQNIEDLCQTVTDQSWREVLDTWIIFRQDCENLDSERAQIVACEIFQTGDTARQLALAERFHDMIGAPAPLLKLMKDMQSSIKANKNKFITAIDKELVAIARVRNYKDAMWSAVGSFFLSGLITIGNYYSSRQLHALDADHTSHALE
eukprot:TRINITY_DN17405_c0_g1_i1.p1 TRINITY_DN17405_c0_g1~~TRINITY_DN17405_c0_g1_i1.p1  ORF type:complete len:436 (+),score=118.11 TRINITY_DN17405_c0_g1_i1:176-1483(+)